MKYIICLYDSCRPCPGLKIRTHNIIFKSDLLTNFPRDLSESFYTAFPIVPFWCQCWHIVPSKCCHNVNHSLGLIGVRWDHAREKIIPGVITQFWSCRCIADLRYLQRISMRNIFQKSQSWLVKIIMMKKKEDPSFKRLCNSFGLFFLTYAQAESGQTLLNMRNWVPARSKEWGSVLKKLFTVL